MRPLIFAFSLFGLLTTGLFGNRPEAQLARPLAPTNLQVSAGGVLTGVGVTVTITSPTSASTYDAGSATSVALAGTAFSDRGIATCSYSNNLGGSGSCTGTTSWSIPAVALSVGTNVITVTAVDGAGTQGTDVISVTRSSGTLSCNQTAAGLDSTTVQNFLTNATTAGTPSSPYVYCLPAGTGHWTTQVNWTAPNDTVLLGAGSLTTEGGGDVTVIYDDYPSTNNWMIHIVTGTGGFRLAGLTLKGGTGSRKDNGMLRVSGGGTTTFRLDHSVIDIRSYTSVDGYASKGMVAAADLAGVMDHNRWILGSGYTMHFLNGVGGAGNGGTAWTQSSDWGGLNKLYVEDSYIEGAPYQGGSPLHWIYAGAFDDCHSGGRIVMRFNTFHNTSFHQTHATGHAGDDRGCRSGEIYGNLATSTMNIFAGDEPDFTSLYLTSGGTLAWGNYSAGLFKNGVYVSESRAWGTDSNGPNCLGTWTGQIGTYCQDNVPNGWAYCGTEWGDGGGLDHALQPAVGPSPWDRNDSTFLGYPCLDQPGRGQGDAITGTFPAAVNARTGTRAWLQQKLDPIYIWNNNFTISQWGGYLKAINTGGRIFENLDIFWDTDADCPQNGAACKTGVGVGTLEQRPVNCQPGPTTPVEDANLGGVAWWATNSGGNWNTSTSNPRGVQQNGSDGALWRCDTTNHWVLHYTPLTYPHPLNH